MEIVAFIDEHRNRFGVEPGNHQRLHSEITDDASYTTPAEFEATYYSQIPTTPEVVTQ